MKSEFCYQSKEHFTATVKKKEKGGMENERQKEDEKGKKEGKKAGDNM